MTYRTLISILLALGLFIADAMTSYLGAQAAPGNFIIPPDAAAKYGSYVRPSPAYVDAIVLVANTQQTWTPPANTRFVVLAATCNFYALVGGTAAVPGATTSNGTASELNPVAYYMNPVPTGISFISPGACTVTVAAYLGRVN